MLFGLTSPRCFRPLSMTCWVISSTILRLLVHVYSKIASPLTKVTSVNVSFSWSPEANKAFVNLKQLFSSVPILVPPDLSRQFIVEVDASDNGSVQRCLTTLTWRIGSTPVLSSPICSLLLSKIMMWKTMSCWQLRWCWERASSCWRGKSDHSPYWRTTKTSPTYSRSRGWIHERPHGPCSLTHSTTPTPTILAPESLNPTC